MPAEHVDPGLAFLMGALTGCAICLMLWELL